MAEPFLAEIRMVGFNFAPRGWALCDGQILPINQNQSLYSLLGTTYGGDGRTTFALPDLRGRTPIHEGTGYSLGQKSGEESSTLQVNQIPNHDHSVKASSSEGNTLIPGNNVLARRLSEVYRNPGNLAAMRTGTIANAGGSQGHTNMQPYLAVNFVIAMQGLFPSRN